MLGFVDKEATIVILGLDNAGKTTLQHKLKTGSFKIFGPTARAREEEIAIGGLKVKTWDVGGHQAARRLWQGYTGAADAVIFIIDSSDRERLDEAAEELTKVAHALELPVAVFANKTDIANSLTSAEIMERIPLLNDLSEQEQGRQIALFPISVYRGTGYEEGFRWLAKLV